MTFAKRSTWPNVRQDDDKTISYNGIEIARTYTEEFGPRGGLWQVFPRWPGAKQDQTYPSLEEAFDSVCRQYAEYLDNG